MPHAVAISAHTTLSGSEIEAALALAARAEAADGAAPLNEAAILHLRHDRGAVHRLARAGDELVGYAQLDQTSSPATGQLVVDPEHRRAGTGSALTHELMAAAGGGLQMWALGHSAAAQALAARVGLVVGRELLIMQRALDGDWVSPELPTGVELRPFVVGQDEAAWLAVNARAFVHHPEQGQITPADLDERMAEDWFDPQGFFLAVRGPQLVGFHWTKQHHDHLGEVYVLGVDPAAGGGGLGKVLLARGLTHLQEVGNTEVVLYVEADHERAVGLYRGYGFRVASRDVMYEQPDSTPAP